MKLDICVGSWNSQRDRQIPCHITPEWIGCSIKYFTHRVRIYFNSNRIQETRIYAIFCYVLRISKTGLNRYPKGICPIKYRVWGSPWNLILIVTSLHITLLPQGFRTDFWMMLWGGECPKRTTCWSSDGDVVKKLVPKLLDM